MTAERRYVCPRCGGHLAAVTRGEYSPLNRDQFDAAKAGDFYCPTCPDNGRGWSGLCYWWKSELPPAYPENDYQI